MTIVQLSLGECIACFFGGIFNFHNYPYSNFGSNTPKSYGTRLDLSTLQSYALKAA